MSEIGEDLKNNAWIKMNEEEAQGAYLLPITISTFLIWLKPNVRRLNT